MAKSIENKIKRLVRNECASYSSEWCGMNHYCYMVDTTCFYYRDFDTLPRCKYFEQGVLPVDGQLESEYITEQAKENIEVKRSSKAKPKCRIRCSRCNAYVEANSNRQKYCEDCRKVVKKEKAKLRVQKMRNKG